MRKKRNQRRGFQGIHNVRTDYWREFGAEAKARGLTGAKLFELIWEEHKSKRSKK